MIDALRQHAPALNRDVSIHTTTGPGDGVRIAKEIRGDTDVVGIIGGDGTVHEVVSGLMPDPPPIVIMPSGTGNDYASLFRCPADVTELSEVLERGVGARLDVLKIGERFCINTAGLGFEGMVNQRSHKIKRIKGSLLYLVAVFQTLSSLKCPPFTITTPAGDRYEGNKLLVSVGNGNRTGGAFYLTPDACPDDGLIDVCIVDAMNWGKVLRLLPKSFSGGHTGKRGVRMLRVPSLVIETTAGFPMHIDGELVESAPTRLTIDLIPRVLPVLCKERDDTPLSHPLEQLI